MTIITQNALSCQDIPFYDEAEITRLPTLEADGTLAALWSDPAGMDAEVMSYEEWLKTVGPWTFEPEPSYFEDEVIA